MSAIVSLQVKNGNKNINLSLIDDKLSFELNMKSANNNPISIPARNILYIALDKTKDTCIRINVLVPKDKLTLKLKEFSFQVIDEESTQSWIKAVNSTAYKDAKQAKHFKVFVNPFGGSGKAVKIFNQSVKPIFDAAGCTYDVTMTEFSNHANNAKEVVKNLNLKAYDAIVTVSGDGIIHEIINGLLSRDDALEIDIPIGTIPAGSGNALSICLLGNDHGVSVTHATLNVIKGVPMKIDTCSVTQGNEKYFAFMTLNYGILADGDISTDHLRWMKNFRFFLGTVQALFGNRNYDCELAMKIAEDNIVRIKQNYNEVYDSSILDMKDKPRTLINKYGTVNDPIPRGWTILNDDGYIFYASKVPWVTRNNMVFPFALPSDGLIDLMMIKRNKVSKIKVANICSEAFENGSHVNMKELKSTPD
ncbi:14622_t:CDS:2 [Funneliformis mosseae]|uniref:14622_t:CDS:1 n=1 Tax=Funneliformis mosseae TaxID=27381 RepID=A0A9N9DE76_FUNMO|nr:14622_t:CDS:2 [Funneliformis mosseae]